MRLSERWRWMGLLKGCDYELAASALTHWVCKRRIDEGLGRALERYFEAPSFERAVELLGEEPELILLFRESRPGGVYDMARKPLLVKGSC